jgi:hypothetical protein
MDELKDCKSSRKIFKVAKQAVKGGKGVLGTGCVKDEMGVGVCGRVGKN